MTLCANRIAALVLRAVGSVLGVFGIAVMLTMTDASLMLSYFTMQTNIFTTAAFIVLIVMTAVQLKERGVRGEVAHLGVSLQLALTFFITITFVQPPLGRSDSGIAQTQIAIFSPAKVWTFR